MEIFTWKKITTRKIKIVARIWLILGRPSLKKAPFSAVILLGFFISEWKRLIIAPSYSIFDPTLIVIGLKHFQRNVSQIFVAMKSEIPLPTP